MKNLKIIEHFNVGKAKYLVSYSFGDKTHKDGSEFFDVRIFKSKRAKQSFINELNTK